MIFLKPTNIFQFFFQFILNLFFRLRISLKKRLNLKVKNNIFLSGDFFQSLAKTKKSKNNEFIFRSLDNIPSKRHLFRFKKKKWIFHNSDETFDIKALKKLSYFKPVKCYSQNLALNKKGFYFLPIGLENNKYQNHGDINDFKMLRKVKTHKISRILYGFNIRNSKRFQITKILKKLKTCDETKGWNSYVYRRILKKYMFVICPEGNGIDTHRFWEALYLYTIPIIQKNKISRFLTKANLPVLVLDKWSDLSRYDEKKLIHYYLSNRKLFKNSYLFQNYWKKNIK